MLEAVEGLDFAEIIHGRLVDRLEDQEDIVDAAQTSPTVVAVISSSAGTE